MNKKRLIDLNGAVMYNSAIADGNNILVDLSELEKEMIYSVSGIISRTGNLEDADRQSTSLELKYIGINLFEDFSGNVYKVIPYISTDEYIRSSQLYLNTIRFNGKRSENTTRLYNNYNAIRIKSLEYYLNDFKTRPTNSTIVFEGKSVNGKIRKQIISRNYELQFYVISDIELFVKGYHKISDEEYVEVQYRIILDTKGRTFYYTV